MRLAPRSRAVLRMLSKRLALIPLTLVFVVSLSFLLLEIMPGDQAAAILGPLANARELETVRQELGLDRPFTERYFAYLTDVTRGDLGRSLFTRRRVADEILEKLPATLELVVPSLIFSALLGVSLGTLAARFKGTVSDTMTRVLITVLQAIPQFLLGLLLLFTFFYLLRMAPSPTGRLGLADTYPATITRFLLLDLVLQRDWSTLWSALARSILPVLTLTLGTAPYFAKIARTTVAAALDSRQVHFARACGLSEWRVLQYALLESRTPILTYSAMLLGTMVGGSSIVEMIFSWQGLGQWGLAAIIALDVPAIQGFVIATGLFTMVVYVVLDVAIFLLDPRIRRV